MGQRAGAPTTAHARPSHRTDAGRALAAASERFAQGAVGAGTGIATAVDALFAAAVEAVLNALWHADTTTGRSGRVAHALPHAPVLAALGLS